MAPKVNPLIRSADALRDCDPEIRHFVSLIDTNPHYDGDYLKLAYDNDVDFSNRECLDIGRFSYLLYSVMAEQPIPIAAAMYPQNFKRSVTAGDVLKKPGHVLFVTSALRETMANSYEGNARVMDAMLKMACLYARDKTLRMPRILGGTGNSQCWFCLWQESLAISSMSSSHVETTVAVHRTDAGAAPT